MAFSPSRAVPAFLLTAGLVWFGGGLHPWWPLAWVMPLPMMLYAIHHRAWPTAVLTFSAAFVGAFTMWGYFHDTLEMPLGASLSIFALTSMVLTVVVLLFRALVHRGAFGLALFGAPALWVTAEYANSLTSPHGTNGSLAYTQLDFLPALQLASITGPWGISFVLLLTASALALGSGRSRDARARRVAIAGLALAAASLVFGVVRLASPQPGTPLKVGLLASDTREHRPVAPAGEAASHVIADYAERIPELVAQGAQVVVLPEKLAVLVGPEVAAAEAPFQQLADRSEVPIVAGVVRVEGGKKFNEARLYTPHEPVQSYDKQHMLPPFESDLEPGVQLTTLRRGDALWGLAVCKDLDFSAPASLYGKAGAGLLLVPAWDFVVDAWAHGHIAIMRGVESGAAIVRSARGGFLTVSDDRGRVLAETSSGSAPFASLVATVPTGHEPTLYLRAGDWVAWLSIALAALSVARLLLRRPLADSE